MLRRRYNELLPSCSSKQFANTISMELSEQCAGPFQKGTSLFGVRQNDMMRTSSFSQLVSSKDSVFWGWIYVVFGSLFFLCFLYAAIISKLLPPSENVIISAIQNDRYYCFLVPLTLPILVVAVYFHWLSMKLFKHA